MVEQNKTDLSKDPSLDLCSQKTATQKARPFIPQGFIENGYYFYVKQLDKVVCIKTNQFKQGYLLKLARIEHWRSEYPSTDRRKLSGVDWNQVEAELITECLDRGEFQGASIRTRVLRHRPSNVCQAKNVEPAQ